ncbi:sodium:solute symporter [Lichenicola cladoniae]|uniref:Sodium:solute symporter n=2 Tax=Lichenicola cladoniae TaxID=1484109 RepID=A0A6M8HVR3_9PROT|nr:sodium:solute symporter [Acetobacteraceae bacterium]QKE92326.1 sodium:solute symporter [Lichenicola cladoniae]
MPTAGWAGIAVFLVFFVATILLGASASWRKGRGRDKDGEDWSLGGRSFGTWVTWFIVGGDFYTAYTIIAVPAVVYATGAYGFFALPYTIIVYPFVYAVMPRLCQIAKQGGHVIAADIVRARFGSRSLERAIGVTGLVSVVPYIALQLVGIRTVLEALGLPDEIPLIAAFLSLAAYTWFGGLDAPATTAFLKDLMIYIVVIAAVTVIPLHLGGYGTMFAHASVHLKAAPDGHVLGPGESIPHATLALSSALAAFLYPHTLTGVLAAHDADTIRRNAVMLPAYTVLLGLMAHAAGIVTTLPSSVVPLLFLAIFPGWIVGFAFAAIAVGALVPAAVMAIGAASLVTRNLLPGRGNARAARTTALLVKVAALGCILLLNPQFAIDLQLLGSVWMLQTLPALVIGLLPLRLTATGLLAGWAAGMAAGSWIVFADGLKPVHALHLDGSAISIPTGLLALNVVVSLAVSLPARRGATGTRAV